MRMCIDQKGLALASLLSCLAIPREVFLTDLKTEHAVKHFFHISLIQPTVHMTVYAK